MVIFTRNCGLRQSATCPFKFRLGVILWETDRTGAKESSVQSFCVACEAFGTSDSGFRVFDYKGDSTRTLPSPSKDH